MIEYAYLRPKKAAWLKDQVQSDMEQRNDPGVWRVRNATVPPPRTHTRLRKTDNCLPAGDISDQADACSGLPGTIEAVTPFRDPQYRDEKVVYCGHVEKTWADFLLNTAARLWYVLRQDQSVDKYVFFLGESTAVPESVRLFLELLGIWELVEFIRQPVTYREVISPEPGLSPGKSFCPQLPEVFRTVADNIVPAPDWGTPEKLFIPLPKQEQPYTYGMDAMLSFFARNGYTILYPETTSLERLIYSIRHAGTVALLSGSPICNLLFSPPGQSVQIIERSVLVDSIPVAITRMNRLRTAFIDAFLPVYPVEPTGPVILAYNDCMARFAGDHSCIPPADIYLQKKFYNQCFRKYARAYQRLYHFRWMLTGQQAACAPIFLEGYHDSLRYFEDFLYGHLPFLPEHYFQRHYWKQFVKDILNRFR